VLFDEIEKAHHDVFNILLQILDDGRLTDGQGRTVDFRNTVIIMTSNIGSKYILEMTEKNVDFSVIETQIKETLKEYFRPEFLNRIDEIIVFRNLTKDDLMKIVDIQTMYINKNLAQRKLSIKLTSKAKEYFIEQGYDINFGARPLKRVIQQEIMNPLAMKILSGEFKEGDAVLIDYDPKKGLIFKIES